MGNPITHNREDAKKNIITSIREVTNNRRDRRHDYRKTSRPFMRKMQTRRILRIWPEASTLKFWVPEYLAAALFGSAMQL